MYAELVDTLRRKGLTLQLHYSKPAWVVEARAIPESRIVAEATAPDVATAVSSLLDKLR
jgi:hypothetical protein